MLRSCERRSESWLAWWSLGREGWKIKMRDPLRDMRDMRDHLRDQERDIMADRLDSERLRGFCDWQTDVHLQL